MPRYVLYKSERVDDGPVLEYVECGSTDDLQAAQDHLNAAPGNNYKDTAPPWPLSKVLDALKDAVKTLEKLYGPKPEAKDREYLDRLRAVISEAEA